MTRNENQVNRMERMELLLREILPYLKGLSCSYCRDFDAHDSDDIDCCVMSALVDRTKDVLK